MNPTRFDMISVYTFYINRRELIQTSIIIYASFIPFLHTHTQPHTQSQNVHTEIVKKDEKKIQMCRNVTIKIKPHTKNETNRKIAASPPIM